MNHVAIFPMTIVSESNQRDPWPVKAERTKRQKSDTHTHLLAQLNGRRKFVLEGLTIELTRLAPTLIKDRYGNLETSFKAIQDGVADYLQIDDGDPRLRWSYQQAKSKEKLVRVEFFEHTRTCSACGRGWTQTPLVVHSEEASIAQDFANAQVGNGVRR